MISLFESGSPSGGNVYCMCALCYQEWGSFFSVGSWRMFYHLSSDELKSGMGKLWPGGHISWFLRKERILARVQNLSVKKYLKMDRMEISSVFCINPCLHHRVSFTFWTLYAWSVLIPDSIAKPNTDRRAGCVNCFLFVGSYRQDRDTKLWLVYNNLNILWLF